MPLPHFPRQALLLLILARLFVNSAHTVDVDKANGRTLMLGGGTAGFS